MSKVNLTIGFEKDGYKELEKLQKSLGKGSKSEVIRCAIMLLKRTTKVQENEGKIILQEKNGVEREVLLI